MGRFRQITVQVDVSVDDVLDELRDDELASEMATRRIGSNRDVVTTAIAQIRRGDTLDAITTLEREFWPKWASVPVSEAAFRAAANDNQEAAPTSAAA